MCQPLQQSWQRQQLETSGCQFNCQGQTIETPADLDNKRGLLIAELKCGLNLPRSCKEEGDRSIARQCCAVRQGLWIRQGERRHRKHQLAAYMQHFTTGHQYREMRTASQQLYQLWRGFHHLLEVVQHEQEMSLPQCHLQLLQRRSGAAVLQAKGLQNGREHQLGIGNGGERNEADTIREARLDLVCDSQRQVGLAYPSRTGQGEQTDLWTREQVTNSGNLQFPTNEQGE